MEYNLAGIRQRVLVDKLDDDEFDPNVVDNFINDTQRNIFNQFELPFQEKIFKGELPTGVSMFKLPDDVAQIQSQTVSGVPGFQDMKVDSWREFFNRYSDAENAPASAPQRWTLYGGNILFSAPTDQPYTMTIYYIRKPKTLRQNEDIPEVPEEFSELLILGTLMRIQRQNEDFDLASETEAEYEKQLMLLVNRYGAREANGPIIMKNQQRRG